MGYPTTKPQKPRMRHTQETYDGVLAAFRIRPGNISYAHRETGIDAAACKRLWERGWPYYHWARPIRDVLGEETAAARVIALERARKERELTDVEKQAKLKARKEALVEEELMMTHVRKNVLGAALVGSKLIGAMHGFANVISDSILEKDAAGKPTGKLLLNHGVKPEAAMKLLKDYVSMVHKLAYAEEVVTELGKLDRGNDPALAEAVEEYDDEAILENLTMISSIKDQMEKEIAERLGKPEPDDEGTMDGSIH